MSEKYLINRDSCYPVNENELAKALDRYLSDEEDIKSLDKISVYILNNSEDKISEEEFRGELEHLLIGRILENLTNDGYLEVIFDSEETKYELTKKGEEEVERLKDLGLDMEDFFRGCSE